MPILKTFCNALRQAITEYETQNNPIPSHRQDAIADLRTRLDERERDRVDSVILRDEMIDYVERLPVGFWAFIPLFDSRLRKKLNEVLNREEFSEKKLDIAERSEIRQSKQATIDTLDTHVNELNRLLAEERAKDNVTLVNQLQQELNKKENDIVFLTQENAQLQQSLEIADKKFQRLEADYTKVSQEKAAVENNYQALSEKYEALLRENASRNEEHSHVSPGNFLN